MKNAIVAVSLVMATPMFAATPVATRPISHLPALVSSEAPAWELCEDRALKVVLMITVNEAGDVSRAVVVRATTPCAGLVARAAVERWKFTPLDAPEGMPRAVSWIIKVRD